MSELIFKFIRFCVVGFSGMLIDYSLTYLGKEKLKINKYVANGFGFICAATTNFFFNKFWTFEDSNPDQLIQYSKYLSIALVGLGINTLVIYLLVNKKDMNFYLAKLIAIAVAIVWNFTANYNFTFLQ
ncbi:MAG: GtrA family protein [Cytophagia bacterium]|nr:GtrA family protein [Cytophagia bacterium]